MDRVKLDKMESVLEPLFYMWRTERLEKEGFGDFVFRQVPVSHICFWLGKEVECHAVVPIHTLFRREVISASAENFVYRVFSELKLNTSYVVMSSMFVMVL